MKIFKFEIEWHRENWVCQGDDTNRLEGISQMRGIVNIISNNEQLARLVFEQYWQHYPWMKYRIVQLVSEEPIYMTALLTHAPMGPGDLLEVHEQQTV